MLPDKKNQILTVLGVQLFFFLMAALFCVFFWKNVCDDNILQCFQSKKSYSYFIFVSFIRSFTFAPTSLFDLMFAHSLRPWSFVLGSISSTISSIPFFILGKIVGNNLVNPWLKSNLPQTLSFLQSQDRKIILATRLMPFLPFDFMSLLFGIANFRWKFLILMTFLGSLPSSYVVTHWVLQEESWKSLWLSLLSINGIFLLPGLFIEFLARRRGMGLWMKLKAMGHEILEEIKQRNTTWHPEIQDGKIPVVLLYGFFSSRRSISILERRLSSKGYSVMSFNLGGLFGVFFTRGIIESAYWLDLKLQRYFAYGGASEIQVVAHSKGGLVALWWLLKLGGYKRCHKIITMGTPFRGSWLSWLALVTPLGFWFRDVWQMRPGSSFLEELSHVEIPPNLKIYNLYSSKDKVSPGVNSILNSQNFSPQIVPVAVNHVSHFSYLYRKDVGEVLTQLLGSPL